MATFGTPEDALEHFGVKGMKWGVRKERPKNTSPETTSSEQDKQRRSISKKQAAAGLLALTAAAGAGYVAYSMVKNGKKPANLGTSLTQKGAEASKKILQEPNDLIYVARGKNKGLTFHKKGNTPDFFEFFDQMGMNTLTEKSVFQRASDGSGRIAARLPDPKGRTDFSGRAIAHDIIIPKSMADGVNSLEDVQSKIWPKIKDLYEGFYQESLKPKY